MMRAWIYGVILGLSGIVASPVWADTIRVAITDYAFVPATVTVHAGDVVIWTNGDSVPHTATARDGKSFDTGTIDPGASGRAVFSKPGHYDYDCTVHPDMRGSVDVK